MSEIIILAGLSGSGKTFLARHLPKLEKNIKLVKKYSDRPARDYEKARPEESDLRFSSSEVIGACDYKYTYGGSYYGIKKSDIDATLLQGLTPLLVVRDAEIISEIQADYPSRVLTIYIKSALSGSELQQKLKDEGLDDISVEERLRRDHLDLNQFFKFSEFFDGTILNDYNPDNFISNARRHIKQFREKSAQHGYAFLIMPFESSMNDVHQAVIRAPALSDRPNFIIERLDSIIDDYTITDKIIQCIKKSEFVVADLSLERPNVYYELGYARGIGKEVLQLAHANTKLHFDISGVRTDFYENAMDAQDKVIKFINSKI